MLTVEDIWDDAKRIAGNCSDTGVYSAVSDAIEILANKGDWDPLVGYVDLCCAGRDLALPSEVLTPRAVWINGAPSLAHNEMFAFHLNGPGDEWSPVTFGWADAGTWPTYRDLPEPTFLYAASTDPTDAGLTITVRGFDQNGDQLREVDRDGLLLPIQGTGSVVLTQQRVGRITRIEKPVTKGRVRLFSADFNASICNGDGAVVGDWQYWETSPQYRRIRLSHAATYARVQYRRRTARVTRKADLIHLHSRMAILSMLRAIRAYNNDDVPLGMQNEATALRWLTERETAGHPPGANMPLQVNVAGGISHGSLDNDVT